MKTKNGFTFFFTAKDHFSNWYIRPFTVAGKVFNCGEQYMMYSKAILFGDFTAADTIMSLSEPKDQKAEGRKVKGFDQLIWDGAADNLLVTGLMEKFSQHLDLKAMLLKTEGTVLVEASKYDKIWGAGLDVNHPDICNPDKWPGANRLGGVLTRVRSGLSCLEPSKLADKSEAFDRLKRGSLDLFL